MLWYGLALSLMIQPSLSLQAQTTNAPVAARPASSSPEEQKHQTPENPLDRIRDEGLNHSQVMDILSHLTEVIGPRLTGSPAHKRANEWTRDQLAGWGITNAHLESAGLFGRGWTLKKFSAQLVEPQGIPLVAWPKAWSTGLEWPVVGEVVYLDARSTADLEKYKGKLKGAIVLMGTPREVKARFEPYATRLTDADLLKLANADPARRGVSARRSPEAAPARATNAPASRRRGQAQAAQDSPSAAVPGRTNEVQNPRPSQGSPWGFTTELARFAVREGAAVLASPSYSGDGGTVFSGAASVIPMESPATNAPAFSRFSPWATNAPAGLPQISLAIEDYNRLVRMVQHGQKLKMAVELQVQFQENDPFIHNTIAEIPGSSRQRELVMLGAHLDSWHVGTGATDDAAGVAVCMEAMRILKGMNFQPKRSIRVGLWTGEEQGFLGSRAYVNQHFGYFTNLSNSSSSNNPERQASSTSSRDSRRKLVRKSEYDQLAAYFNLDNGGGKIRGIHLQSNEAVGPIFRRWLGPFQDLGAETISLSNTGGTDHIPFDAVGLPGFQFIQDPLDYMSRTHHSTADVLDRIQADDLKQAAVIMATFVYQAAMAEQKLPRKPLN